MVNFLENSEMVGFPTSKILGDLTRNDPREKKKKLFGSYPGTRLCCNQLRWNQHEVRC